MRHRVAIVLLAGLLGAALSSCGSSRSQTSSASHPPAGSASCGPAHTPTLTSSASARVYLSGRIVYGCSVSGSRRTLALGQRAVGCLGGGRVQAVALSGNVVAFGIERCGVDTGSTTVTVRRLTDGAVLSSTPAITGVAGVESFQSVGTVVVGANGAAAWVADMGSIISHRHVSELHRIDAGGAKLLDSGPTGSITGLRLSGSQLSWRHAGASRSASL